MSPDQQLIDVFFNIFGLIFSSLVGVFFDFVLVPLLQSLLEGIFGGTP